MIAHVRFSKHVVIASSVVVKITLKDAHLVIRAWILK